ncbi:hypothetical protein MtrunA17_Chr4g0034921 [Medicago truncatula]|uniref:Uncharacterized protein n=1 Tax=Medicago truncatula TaxID=3880 RepID=A0A396I6N5_MEDTR|nr:hypothetical protein MtrunA17_Chr4g0034921 [Medicago truncatula]
MIQLNVNKIPHFNTNYNENIEHCSSIHVTALKLFAISSKFTLVKILSFSEVLVSEFQGDASEKLELFQNGLP